MTIWTLSLIHICGYSYVGAVVGATYPEQARITRKLMPKAYILVPGYGAQGATAKAVSYTHLDVYKRQQYPACSVHGALLCADYGICRERDGRTACLQL